MELNSIFSILVWVALGALVASIFIRNRTSADPSSLKDEVKEIKDYIDSRLGRLEDRFNTQSAQPIVVQSQPSGQSTEKLEVKAENVEVFNNRASDETSTSAGAKTEGLEIDNDAVLNIKPRQE